MSSLACQGHHPLSAYIEIYISLSYFLLHKICIATIIWRWGVLQGACVKDLVPSLALLEGGTFKRRKPSWSL
jgi:hypothetical protein